MNSNRLRDRGNMVPYIFLINERRSRMFGKNKKDSFEKEQEKIALHNAKLNMGIPDFLDSSRYSQEEEERMHEEELRRRLEAMDERDLKIIAEYIPYDLLIDRIRSELIEKMEWKIKIDEMYNRFHNV